MSMMMVFFRIGNYYLGCLNSSLGDFFSLNKMCIRDRYIRQEKVMRAEGEQLLEAVGLLGMAGEEAKNLPYGQQRKMCIRDRL